MLENCLYIHSQYFSDALDYNKADQLLLDMLAIFREISHDEIPIKVGRSYWDYPLGPGLGTLFDLVLSENRKSSLSGSEIRELTSFFMRCRTVEDAEHVIVTEINKVTIPHCPVFRAAHIDSKENKVYPAFLHPPHLNLSGESNFVIGNHLVKGYAIRKVSDVYGYFRNQICLSIPTGGNFRKIANRAFPDLLIHDEVDPAELGIDLFEHMDTVLLHLAFLNDIYKSVGTENKWNMPSIQRIAKAHQVNFSDESGRTKADSKKMARRNVRFLVNGKNITFMCSLHTKITATAGRIHFHNPHSNSEERVIIGIFHKHLPV